MLPLLAVVLPSLLLSLPSSGSPQLLAPPLPQPQKKPSTLDNPKQCEPVAIPMCQNMRYNATAMPNHFGHLTQKEAGAQIEHFAALVMVGCSAELQASSSTVYKKMLSFTLQKKKDFDELFGTTNLQNVKFYFTQPFSNCKLRRTLQSSTF